MSTILKIKDDLKFYDGLLTLTKAVKAVAILQFHTLENKIVGFEKFLSIVEDCFELIGARKIRHPFINVEDRPVGAIAVTSETGLLGGLNNRIMLTALSYLKNPKDKLIVVGFQGQNFARASRIPFKAFPSILDEKRHLQAVNVRDYIYEEVLNERLGSVKIVYPHPVSIIAYRIVSVGLFPCTEWCRNKNEEYKDIIYESSTSDIIEYLTYSWVGQKIYNLFGYSRLAELSARITHLEGCNQEIEQTEKQLKIQYHKARHQMIDQQMRELFSARALYAR